MNQRPPATAGNIVRVPPPSATPGKTQLINHYTIESTTEKSNKYLDIIKTQFEITKLEIIERRDDIHTTSSKIGDFTSETIKKLIKEGYESTWKKFPQFVIQRQQ